jgi:site-specific DNA recombinase
MLDDIEAGPVPAVVTYHLDRLHRSPKELEEFVEVCQRAGLGDVATVTGDLDIAKSDGLFSARILTAVARKSSDDSSRGIRRKMEDIAREGRPSGGGLRPSASSPMA